MLLDVRDRESISEVALVTVPFERCRQRGRRPRRGGDGVGNVNGAVPREGRAAQPALSKRAGEKINPAAQKIKFVIYFFLNSNITVRGFPSPMFTRTSTAETHMKKCTGPSPVD